ncbi:MAG: 30S ribosomal protein S3ae [Candidatus Micrarchaeota archaeon]|nr:30S ribosomal protein S3ae [Candidatus Micrarchaeota archaeon]
MAVKKTVDTWKMKSWYSVVAPKFLNEVEVAQIPAMDESRLINRVIQIPLRDVTRDVAHLYTNIRLRIHEVKGRTAYTKFIGHEVAREYIHTMVRRGREKMDVVFPAVSKDGVEFSIKAVIITEYPASSRKKTAVRNALVAFLKTKAKEENFGKFIMDVLYGKASQEAVGKLRKIVPIRRVEIRKTQLKEEFDTAEVPEPAAAPAQPAEAETTAQA